MQFKLRTVFVVMIVLSMLFASYKIIDVNWFAARRTAIEAQATFDRLIAENKWDGIIVPTHSSHLVLISINDVDETELQKLYPSLHEIFWLRHILVDRPVISQTMMAELLSEFPDCKIEARIYE